MDHVPALRLMTGGADEIASAGHPSDHGQVRLTLPARAENIAMIRHVIGALAESLLLPRGLVEDVRLAVTEACTNVVRHAYADPGGQIDIAVEPAPGRLSVTVADTGHGMRLSPPSDGAGLGLPLITALTEDFEIDQPEDGGSVLHMSFRSRTGRFTPA